MTVSIRSRLTIWYSLVMLAGFALFGVTAWYALQNRLMAAVDVRLALRMQGVRSALGETAEVQTRPQLAKELGEYIGEVPDGSVVQLRDRSGVLFFGSANLPAAPRTITGSMDAAGETWSVLIALPLDEQRSILRDFRGILLWLIPAVLVLACGGGYWLSTRALRPVDEITAAARNIGLQNLSKRIPVPATGDELERMGRTWNEVLERLDNAVQRIRRFTADASHELRSPLALIRTASDLALRKERDPEEYRRSLAEIQAQAVQMTDLTESLLTLARADFEGTGLRLEPTDLNRVVSEEVKNNQVAAIGKGVRLSAAVNGYAARVNASGPAIQRLLRILIENGIRHTPPGGSVTVTFDGAVLTVQDTGEGIAPADMPHIFERFYRADQVRTSGSGFGLGLSIAQTIAEAHNSTIEVTSTPGVGSRFWMRLV